MQLTLAISPVVISVKNSRASRFGLRRVSQVDRSRAYKVTVTRRVTVLIPKNLRHSARRRLTEIRAFSWDSVLHPPFTFVWQCVPPNLIADSDSDFGIVRLSSKTRFQAPSRVSFELFLTTRQGRKAYSLTRADRK
jgi:hypothetical protein